MLWHFYVFTNIKTSHLTSNVGSAVVYVLTRLITRPCSKKTCEDGNSMQVNGEVNVRILGISLGEHDQTCVKSWSKFGDFNPLQPVKSQVIFYENNTLLGICWWLILYVTPGKIFNKHFINIVLKWSCTVGPPVTCSLHGRRSPINKEDNGLQIKTLNNTMSNL